MKTRLKGSNLYLQKLQGALKQAQVHNWKVERQE